MPRRRALTFKDAVRMLEGDSRLVASLDELIAHAFDAVPGGKLIGLPYFAFRSALVEYANGLVGSVRDRVQGSGRYDRTERLLAAHAVIVMTAFAEALGELLDGVEVRAELLAERPAANGQTGALLWFDHAIPEPAPAWGAARRLDAVRTFYGVCADGTRKALRERGRYPVPVDDTLIEDLPERAVRRYEEYFRRLAAEVPEFAAWAYLAEHAATRAELGRVGDELHARLDTLTTGLAGIPELLDQVAGRAAANRVRTDLEHAHQAVLGRSVLGETQAPDNVVLPTLEQAYVNPACRAGPIDAAARPSEDHWWEDRPAYDDLQELVVGALTAPDALDRPLVILGQPGAGKSVLTRMLAARLADRGFLPVRVALRNVPADADVQTQIEHAIRESTGRRTDWPDVADSAAEDGLLPLILLDGFDELLQATGINQSGYLEQVATFQGRELALGRPVAVVVTSRTAVADRARFPDGVMALRLEPFDEPRVRTWLGVWNEANAASLAARGVAPLSAEVVGRYADLAEQPLLLLLLALYDADAGALQSAGQGLGRAELYERLLTDFARREVRKAGADLDDGQERRAVVEELRRLSIVALAMFNRHAQVITGPELDRDLAALLPDGPSGEVAGGGLAKPLTAAQIMVGRFFFVHESRAVREGDTEHAYEFLHATFGEFLVARYVIETLRTLARDREHFRATCSPGTVDEEVLWAALSFAALTGSAARVEFVEGLLGRLADDERDEIRELVTELIVDAQYEDRRRPLGGYRPDRLPAFQRHAYYSANLALLAVLSSDEPLVLRPFDVRMWQHALISHEFDGMLDTVRAQGVLAEGWYRWLLVREDGSDVDSRGALSLHISGDEAAPAEPLIDDPPVSADSEAGKLIRESAYDPFDVRSIPALLPYLYFVGDGVQSGTSDGELFVPWARLLLELRLAPFAEHGAVKRERIYWLCFENDSPDERFRKTVLRQLREEAGEFDPPALARVLQYALEADALQIAPQLVLDLLSADESTRQQVASDVRRRLDEIEDLTLRERFERVLT